MLTADSSLLVSNSMKRNLENVAVTKTFHEGDIILDENAYIRYLPIVLSGSIRVMRTDEDGREILLYYIRPGESCIMSFLGGVHHEKSKIKAVAEEEVEMLLIPIDKMNFLLKENADWQDYIFKLYHKRFEELLEVVNQLAFKHIDDRIINYLREKAKLTGSKEIAVTHQQIADEVGTARVVVSRILKQMEVTGQLILGRNKISLV